MFYLSNVASLLQKTYMYYKVRRSFWAFRIPRDGRAKFMIFRSSNWISFLLKVSKIEIKIELRKEKNETNLLR